MNLQVDILKFLTFKLNYFYIVKYKNIIFPKISWVVKLTKTYNGI